MASLTLTPSFYALTVNSDGTYSFVFAMNNAAGQNMGNRTMLLKADGTTWINGVATGLTLTGAQMTTLGNVVAAISTHIANADAAGKIVF